MTSPQNGPDDAPGSLSPEEESTLQHITSVGAGLPLGDGTIDFVLRLAAGEGHKRERYAELARKALREWQNDAPTLGSLLAEGRAGQRLSVAAAAALLGVAPDVLELIEKGQNALLRRQAPERVAAYVERLQLTPSHVARALFGGLKSRVPFGYTPGVTADERGRVLDDRLSEQQADDRQWLGNFLRAIEHGA